MEELYKLIPDEYAHVIASRLSTDKLSEIRVRNKMPVRVGYDGMYCFLGKSGLVKTPDGAFIAGESEAENVVMRACERSLYTVTDTIKNGYIAVRGGIRIGVCGSGVGDGEKKIAVKDFSSVNIRLPHEVKGCAATLLGKVLESGGVHNTLIVSPPGAGKTTMLRDLCRLISNRGKNVLLCDEKYEIASVRDGAPMLDVGVCTDVISGRSKSEVFEIGIAAMRPDIVMTDELMFGDISCLSRAVHCGISVVSTVHAKDLDDFLYKHEYKEISDSGIFTRYAVLTDAPNRGVVLFNEKREVIL